MTRFDMKIFDLSPSEIHAIRKTVESIDPDTIIIITEKEE